MWAWGISAPGHLGLGDHPRWGFLCPDSPIARQAQLRDQANLEGRRVAASSNPRGPTAVIDSFICPAQPRLDGLVLDTKAKPRIIRAIELAREKFLFLALASPVVTLPSWPSFFVCFSR